MNIQEIFNKVYIHLTKQAAKSFMPSGQGCAYRSKDGKMCAIGCLINDNVYNVRLEQKGAFHEWVQQALEESGVQLDDEKITLLNALQIMHDSMPVEDWLDYLKGIAEGCSLEIPTLN